MIAYLERVGGSKARPMINRRMVEITASGPKAVTKKQTAAEVWFLQRDAGKKFIS